jgi:hypothetical protein
MTPNEVDPASLVWLDNDDNNKETGHLPVASAKFVAFKNSNKSPKAWQNWRRLQTALRGRWRPSDQAEWVQISQNHSKFRKWDTTLKLTTFMTLSIF